MIRKLRKGDTFTDPDEGEFVVTGEAIGGVMARSVSGHIEEHFVAYDTGESDEDEDSDETDHIKKAKTLARKNFCHASPYRVGRAMAELGYECKSPYVAGSRGDRHFKEGHAYIMPNAPAMASADTQTPRRVCRIHRNADCPRGIRGDLRSNVLNS